MTCLAGKVELGQGAMTELAQVLSEELDVSLDTVDVVMGDTDLCPYDMGTFGSMTTPLLLPAVRRAGAEAKAVLVQMASERLKVPAGRLRAQAGTISEAEKPSNAVTYGQLVAGKRIERHLANVPVKAADLHVIGTSPRRKDGLDKVTGRARYAGDILLPGLLHAAILRPPAHGARLKSADTSAAEKVSGVLVVKDGGMIAVLHERPDIAAAALGRIQAEFENPPAGPDDKTIFDHIQKTAPQPQLLGQDGDLAQGERLAGSVIEQTYLNSYVAHAPIETHTATAQFEDGKVTVWASTQAPFQVKNAVASALGLPAEKVRVISRYVGGGFGGKTEADQAVEAARLAKITGKPVQVVYSRQEEFFYDRLRPAAVMKIRAGVAGGKIVLWDSLVFGAGEQGADPFYDIPHKRVTSAGGWHGGNPPGMHPFSVGPWRAPSVKQQYVRPGIAYRPTGGASWNRPAGVSAEQPDACEAAARPGNRGPAVRVEGRPRAHRTRCRNGLRHLFQRLQRYHRGSGREPRYGRGAGEARRDGAGRGDGGQPRRNAATGRRRRDDGPGLLAERGIAVQRRRAAQPRFRKLSDSAILLAAEDRNCSGG